MIHVILLVGLIWTSLSLVTYVLILPLLRDAKRGDELLLRLRLEGKRSAPWVEPVVPGRRAASSARKFPVNPVEAGYAGLVLQRLTVHTTTVLGATEVCLMAVQDHPPHRLVTVAEHGIGVDAILEAPPPRHRVAWQALADGGSIAVPTRAPLLRTATRIAAPPARASITATPIFWQGHVRGVLSAAVPVAADGKLQAGQVRLLEDLGGVVAQAFEHQRRRELTSADTGAEVLALLEALKRGDPATRERGRKVLSLARLVGRQLTLDPVSAYELELTAMLSDVGTLRVPFRSGRPSDGPMHPDVVSMHPVWGFEMVAGIPGLEPLAALVRAHHERWDGLGYPDGLAGARIPLASRIVAACEAAAAVAAGFPGPRRRPTAAARDALEQGAGTRFDPGVVVILVQGISGGATGTPPTCPV